MSQMNYTPDANDLYVGFEPVPADTYRVQIVDSAIKETKSGNGKILTLTDEIVGHPTLSGRKIFDVINIENPSVDAVRIGRQKLNTICVLAGIKKLRDTAELHGKVITVVVSVGEYNGKPNNRIDKYVVDGSEDGSGPNVTYPNPESGPVKGRPSFIK